MHIKTLATVSAVLLALFLFSPGCQDPSSSNTGGDAHHHDGHGHDSLEHHLEGDHDHPPHGPNHGHIFEFESDDLKGEWCKYKDNNVIRMYLLDADAKTPKALVVQKFLIKPMAGDDEKPFELEAEDVNPEGAASKFMLDDQDLQTAIPFGVKIEVVTEGKTYVGKIKAHKPLDH